MATMASAVGVRMIVGTERVKELIKGRRILLADGSVIQVIPYMENDLQALIIRGSIIQKPQEMSQQTMK